MLGCTLLIGGHETTANQINLSLLALLDHPAEPGKLRADTGLIPQRWRSSCAMSGLGAASRRPG